MTATGLRGRSFVCAMQLSGENKHAVVFVAAPVAAAACAASSSSDSFSSDLDRLLSRGSFGGMLRAAVAPKVGSAHQAPLATISSTSAFLAPGL